MHVIHKAVRPLDQLADLRTSEFRDDAAGLGEIARLVQAARTAVDEVLGVDWRGEADVLGDGRELADGMLRPAERARYEARRIRARTRARASS